MAKAKYGLCPQTGLPLKKDGTVDKRSIKRKETKPKEPKPKETKPQKVSREDEIRAAIAQLLLSKTPVSDTKLVSKQVNPPVEEKCEAVTEPKQKEVKFLEPEPIVKKEIIKPEPKLDPKPEPEQKQSTVVESKHPQLIRMGRPIHSKSRSWANGKVVVPTLYNDSPAYLFGYKYIPCPVTTI